MLKFCAVDHGKIGTALAAMTWNYLFPKFASLGDKTAFFYSVLNDFICKYVKYKRILGRYFVFPKYIKNCFEPLAQHRFL